MKSRVDAHGVDVFTSIYKDLEKAGHKAEDNALDNKCSLAAQHFLEKKMSHAKTLKQTITQ